MRLSHASILIDLTDSQWHGVTNVWNSLIFGLSDADFVRCSPLFTSLKNNWIFGFMRPSSIHVPNFGSHPPARYSRDHTLVPRTKPGAPGMASLNCPLGSMAFARSLTTRGSVFEGQFYIVNYYWHKRLNFYFGRNPRDVPCPPLGWPTSKFHPACPPVPPRWIERNGTVLEHGCMLEYALSNMVYCGLQP